MRCWFHKRQNLQQQVPPQAWPAFKALVAALRDAPTFEEGQRRLQALIEQYQRPLPEACRCLAADAEASLNHLKVPTRHRQYVRPSHLAERACAAERRRTTVIPHVWDEASLVKLVFAVLIRVSERWGKQPESEVEPHQMRALRPAFALDQVFETPAPVTMASQPRRSAASARELLQEKKDLTRRTATLARISHQLASEVAERVHRKIRERKWLPSCPPALFTDTRRLASGGRSGFGCQSARPSWAASFNSATACRPAETGWHTDSHWRAPPAGVVH
jgi:hypothetical protein